MAGGAAPRHDLDRLGGGFKPRWDGRWDGGGDQLLLGHHFLWFCAERRYVAAVGQPYPEAVDLAWWRDHLVERGLVLHVPPDPFASIHNPGVSIFVAVTRPGVDVRWLPEQDGRMKGRWRLGAPRSGRQKEATA